jgi:hypothetical protein
MSEHAATADHGHMDISQNEASFHVFVLLAKWGSLAVASFVLLLVLWFCTSAGFFGALIPALVVAVIGVLVLREKGGSTAGH